MPEPIQPTESLQPQRLTVGETPVYLKTPLDLDGKQVTMLTIKGESTRGKDGIDSSVLLLKDQSRRRGEEGQVFVKPLTNVSAMEEVDWDKVGGIQYTMPDGSVHTITKDQLSLTQPDFSPALPLSPTPDLSISPSPALPLSPTPSREPALARSILETYSGEPTTLTIVGLKAYETRAHDLADRAMQLKTSIGEKIWKQGVGPAYFHERARQYYAAMLKAANSPFAESSIKIAEAAGKNRYQELLNNKNFLTRPTRQFIEWVKDAVGAQTLSQKFALEEIAHMRETGEITEREVFDREAGSIRKRFEQDVDIQDQFIRGTLGEKWTILNPDDPAYKPMVDVIKGLVKGYATGDIATKKDFDKLTDELFQKHLKTARRDVFDQAELYTSSLFEVAEQLRAKAGHEGGLAAIDAQLESMQVRLGMGVMGEATALVPSDVEKGTKAVMKAVEWMEKKGIIGPFVFNEASVGSAVALSLSLSFLPRAGLSGLANGLVGLGAGSVVSGVFGGLREYRNLEKEYLTHIREREAGLTFAPDAKRRAWMEKFMVGQRSADDLITAIRTPLYQTDGRTMRDNVTNDELQSVIANLADAKARRALSGRTDSQRVGLIQFSGRDTIETQRTALDVTIAQAEKDLLSLSSTHPLSPSFIADLTAAQTRILTDGISRVQGLDDPIKVTLGLLNTYNPEADIMRRRFPLIGPDQKTGTKAQGLEEIFKEFRRAAAGEAVKKGLQVGLTSAAIGWVSREVMQAGMETGAAVMTKEPAFGPPVHIANADFQFTNTIQIDNHGNLVSNNQTIIAGFENFLKTHGGLNADGTLSDDAKLALVKEAKDQGISLDIPTAVKSTWNFTNDRLAPLADLKPGTIIQSPPELHWAVARDGAKHLVVDIKDAQGNITQDVLWNSATDTGNPIDAVTRYGLLHYAPEQNISTTILNERIFLPGVAPFPDAQGAIHNIQAMIPKGTLLTETGTLPNGEHVYQLVDSHKATLLGNIHVDQYGQITNLADLNASADAATHHIEFTNPLDSTLKIPIGGSGGGMEKIVGDMGNEKGAHGIWGWVEDPMIASGDVKAITPATNLAKNLFRGYEENVVMKANFILENGTKGGDIPYTAMHPGDKFIDLPKALFEDAQLVKLGKLMDEAIQLREVEGKTLDDLHRMVYEIGRVGRVATKDEVEFMIRELGGGEKAVSIFTPVIKQSVVQTIPGQITGTDTSMVTNLIVLHEGIPVPELPYTPYILLWRSPLEAPMLHLMPGILPPEFTPPQYFTYGGEQVFLTRNEYEDRRSPRLVEKDATLNQHEELAWYLANLSEEDKAHLEVLLAQHADPVPDSAKAVIAIPANKEGLNIYTTLTQYAKQKDLKDAPLDPSTYQIVIYDNRVKGTSADATRAEVTRFQNEHPEMNIVYLEQVLDQKPSIGRVRRNLTNSILKRLETRDPSLPAVAIISNDADSVNIPDRYVATIMDTFAHNARLDAITGRYDFPQEVYKNYPVLFATERAWQLMDAIVRHNEQSGVPQLMGANSAVKAGTLAAIGGYNPKSTLGEDLEIGWMIQSARQSDPTRFHFSNAIKLETDPRRAIYKYLQGAGLLDRYTDFADNTEIRGLSWQEMASRAEEAYSREKLAESLTRMRNELYPWLKKSNPEALDRYFKRAMDFLGVAFELQSDKVTITDDSVLRAGINVNLTPEQIVRNEPAPLPSPATPPRPSVREASAL